MATGNDHPVPALTVVSRDNLGRPVFVRQRSGERFSICCLQSEACAWHREHGDEVKMEAGLDPAPVPVYAGRKPTPKRILRFLAEQKDMFESDDDLYHYLLLKRAQWEQHPDVGWVGYLAYMLQCEYDDARVMARWTDTLNKPASADPSHEHSYEPQSDGTSVKCGSCGDTKPRCGDEHFSALGLYVCVRECEHKPPHRAGHIAW